MTQDEPYGCIHYVPDGGECEICATDRYSARVLTMKAAELRSECRAEGMDPDGIVADLDAATTRAIFSVLSTRSLLDEVIRRLNYDGHDLNSLTIGEIDRAL